jgi:hypothetical protein
MAAMLLLTGIVILAAIPQSRPAGIADNVRDRLENLIRLGLSVDRCGFPMSTDEATRLGDAIDEAVLALRLPYTGYDSIMVAVMRDMDDEGWTRLCRRGGTWERQYRRELDDV